MAIEASDKDKGEIDLRLQLARDIARQAGELTLKYFCNASVSVEKKSDRTPVTIADREAEQLMRKLASEAFPGDAILGEEFGEKEGDTGYRWIFDPIDGTKSFISGVPLYGCMVGVEFERKSVVGAVSIPGLDEHIYASRGGGAWHSLGQAEPQPARVSNCTSLADGLAVTSEVKTFAERDAAEAYSRLDDAAYIMRTWGDCYGYLLVATGRAEAMIDPIMSVWDAAAISPIIEEAGGVFVDWKGEATIHSGEGVGCNPAVLNEVMAITGDYSRHA